MIYDFLKSKLELKYDETRVFKGIPRYLKKLHTNLSKRSNYRKITYMDWSNYMMKIYIINLLR